MKKQFIAYLFLVILCSCKSNENRILNKTNELGGITKTVLSAKSKPIKDSIFDSLNNLVKITEYFEENSHVKSTSSYKGHIKEGQSVEYFSNGRLKSKRYNYLGKECFERIDFTETGNLSKYVFLDSDQRRLYVRLYDNKGNCVNIKGEPFFESYIYAKGNLEFTAKDTVIAYFYAPVPPDCYVKLYTVQGLNEINNIREGAENFIFTVKIYPLTKGSYLWQVKMKIFEKKNDSLIYTSGISNITYIVK